MTGDHEALMGIFRSVAESETLGWRALRQIAANHVAGDVALAAAQRRSYGRDWSWRRLVAEHEAAHVLVRYLVTGTPAGAALLERGSGSSRLARAKSPEPFSAVCLRTRS